MLASRHHDRQRRANGYAFVGDYLAEVFHRLRRHNLGTVVDQLADLDVGSDLNQTAIKKTMSGLLKLLWLPRS